MIQATIYHPHSPTRAYRVFEFPHEFEEALHLMREEFKTPGEFVAKSEIATRHGFVYFIGAVEAHNPAEAPNL